MVSEIVAFPLHRRQGLVRKIAAVLRSKHGEDATLFWRETARRLLRQLADNGVPTPAAEDQVRNVLYAVVAEIEGDAIEARR